MTIAILRDDVLAACTENVPTMLSFRQLAENNSLLNTPPVFAVYVVMLVTRWLLDDIGGLAKMRELNEKKSRLLYDVIDESRGFYQGHAQPHCRSLMNVTYRLPNDEVEAAFLAGAKERGLQYLKGHRSVGGIRASIYNAMPLAGVELLASSCASSARSIKRPAGDSFDAGSPARFREQGAILLGGRGRASQNHIGLVRRIARHGPGMIVVALVGLWLPGYALRERCGPRSPGPLHFPSRRYCWPNR